MIGDAIALYDLIRRIYQDRTIISALFNWQGERTEGDKRLEVQLHRSEDNENVWWYSIQAFEEYQFIRIPVNAGGVIESLGTPSQEGNPDADYFRYVPVPDGHIFGGTISNVRVSFMVFAYKPSDLLSTREATV